MRRVYLITSVVLCLALLSACAPLNTQPQPSPTPEVLATPTHVMGYVLDITKQNPSGDHYAEPTEEFIEKVNLVLRESTDPYNTVFENFLGLYEYLTRHIMFDENGASDTAGALLSGVANKMGFTKTYQYLLHQIGAEAHIATANDGTTSWVMALMSDGFYHFDPAEDVRLSNGQSLRYFAMNDEFR